MKKSLSLIPALLAFAVLIVSSEAAKTGCRDGIRLCTELIIPSLFPFFVLSILLNRLGLPSVIGRALAPAASALYGISGAGVSALFIGLSGGYPLGAAYIADMEKSGSISTNEGERLLAFCNNSGPAFIIGAVGSGAFGSVKAGMFLYAVHAASALICGLFFRAKSRSREIQPVLLDEIESGAALTGAISQSVTTLLQVSGFIVFFSTVTAVLTDAGLPLVCGMVSELTGLELRFSRAAVCGILELGTAVGAMRGFEINPNNLALAAFILGWGGISVHMQTAAVLRESKIKGTLHTAGRLISASTGAAIAYVFAYFVF